MASWLVKISWRVHTVPPCDFVNIWQSPGIFELIILLKISVLRIWQSQGGGGYCTTGTHHSSFYTSVKCLLILHKFTIQIVSWTCSSLMTGASLISSLRWEHRGFRPRFSYLCANSYFKIANQINLATIAFPFPSLLIFSQRLRFDGLRPASCHVTRMYPLQPIWWDLLLHSKCLHMHSIVPSSAQFHTVTAQIPPRFA
jgi:hypothetical protein